MSKDYTVSIYGLDDLKETLNLNRISKRVAFNMGQSLRELHLALKVSITNRYNISHNLDSVLVGNSISTATFGKNIIKNELVYKHKPVDLAKFPYTTFRGNINSWARRKGNVHVVSIKRGQPKISYGKRHFGGFAATNGRYGKQMFERLTHDRFPVQILFTSSLAQMAGMAIEHDVKVQKAVDNITLTILDNI